ncbi:hypothetical protein BXZ70DRAFT_1010954 [Cristinia sonorae]|uniref:DUF6532 domain-containing protein n=1 Tax=Cristinia sonorae TaxID=1940300 RepID=A0A8K0UJE3_9AGAR|nr:hypothetical protein BXZ70DRAFT_1010954 [Cristinia sonorae]
MADLLCAVMETNRSDLPPRASKVQAMNNAVWRSDQPQSRRVTSGGTTRPRAQSAATDIPPPKKAKVGKKKVPMSQPVPQGSIEGSGAAFKKAPKRTQVAQPPRLIFDRSALEVDDRVSLANSRRVAVQSQEPLSKKNQATAIKIPREKLARKDIEPNEESETADELDGDHELSEKSGQDEDEVEDDGDLTGLNVDQLRESLFSERPQVLGSNRSASHSSQSRPHELKTRQPDYADHVQQQPTPQSQYRRHHMSQRYDDSPPPRNTGRMKTSSKGKNREDASLDDPEPEHYADYPQSSPLPERISYAQNYQDDNEENEGDYYGDEEQNCQQDNTFNDEDGEDHEQEDEDNDLYRRLGKSEVGDNGEDEYEDEDEDDGDQMEGTSSMKANTASVRRKGKSTGRRAQNMIAERPQWTVQQTTEQPTPLVDDPIAPLPWLAITDLNYAGRGTVVGIKSQTPPIQDVGHEITKHIIRDAFFDEMYPRSDMVFRRYRSFLETSLNNLGTGRDSLYTIILDRSQQDTVYAKGLISMGVTRLRNLRSELKSECASHIEEEYGVNSQTKKRLEAWMNDCAYIFAGDAEGILDGKKPFLRDIFGTVLQSFFFNGEDSIAARNLDLFPKGRVAGTRLLPKSMLAMIATCVYVALSELALPKGVVTKKRGKSKAANFKSSYWVAHYRHVLRTINAIEKRNVRAFDHMMAKLFQCAFDGVDLVGEAPSQFLDVDEMSE